MKHTGPVFLITSLRMSPKSFRHIFLNQDKELQHKTYPYLPHNMFLSNPWCTRKFDFGPCQILGGLKIWVGLMLFWIHPEGKHGMISLPKLGMYYMELSSLVVFTE